ncbi:MAG: metal-dependent transcriptional regulator [Candidatus Eremiobacteraeota bacterium]|nr:metal-dependent transcriptional regulator [Candidatus Eremiobacteraeota bacterium]
MPGHTHFDESNEEYLEAIYRLDREGPGVSNSSIASELGVAPASVSGMLKKLAVDGYIEHQARGGAKLTEKGLQTAVRVVRRNRLAEVFLTEILGLPWDKVYEEACRLEHAISALVEERLVEVLGDPKFCPHGHPIPPADLSEPAYAGIPVAQLETGSTARLHSVTEQMTEMLRYLTEIGLARGTTLKIVEKAPLGGPITIEYDGRRQPISLELAKQLTAVDVDGPAATERRTA